MDRGIVMKTGYVHQRLRKITAVLSVMLCLVGAYTCLNHLFIYLDVEIFELNLLIEDLIVFGGFVLMAVGAFKVSPLLSGLGPVIVVAKRTVDFIIELTSAEVEQTAEEMLSLVCGDVCEITGLFFGAVVILSQEKAFSFLRDFAKNIWLVPAVLLGVSFVISVFTNPGPLTETTIGLYFMWMTMLCFCVWSTDPKGFPRWIAKRIRENEESEN